MSLLTACLIPRRLTVAHQVNHRRAPFPLETTMSENRQPFAVSIAIVGLLKGDTTWQLFERKFL